MPDWKAKIRERLTGLALDPTRAAAITEEISQDLDDRYDDLIAGGCNSAEAERLTLLELSGRDLLAREIKRAEKMVPDEPITIGTHRRGDMIADLWQDLKYSLKAFVRNPVFTLIVAVTLSLGIGANTMIFSFVNALLLRPLSGVAEPESLVLIGRQYKDKNYMSDSSYPDYLDYRAQNKTLSGLALRSPTSFSLNAGQEAERINGELVSDNYFDVLGVKPATGRLLNPGGDPGQDQAAVISYGLWQRRFGGDPGVIGRPIKLDGFDYIVIGVTAPGFEGVQTGRAAGAWTPITSLRRVDPARVRLFDERRPSWLELFGRLKPGTTIGEARAEFATLAGGLSQYYPPPGSAPAVRLEPGMGLDPEARSQIKRFAYLPFVVVGIVLLIACANVAGLLLARATARRKEIAVRLALGASQGRIIRQLMTESLLLALVGGGLGFLLGVWFTGILRSLLPERFLFLPLDLDFGVDLRVLAFTLAVTIGAALIFGLIPAFQSSRANLTPALKETPPSGLTRARLRSALIVTQIALSSALLVAAGLCVRTLRNARAIDLGYKAENVLTARIALPRQSYSKEQGLIFQRQLLERLRTTPGVQTAGFAVTLPLNDARWETSIIPEGVEQRAQSFQNYISPQYLDLMEIPLMSGRRFSDRDDVNSAKVTIINETLARKLWPNENPLGKRFNFKAGPNEMVSAEVIGVARDARGRNLFESGGPMFYLPLFQHYQSGIVFHVRSVLDPEQLATVVRREIRALDSNLPLYDVKTLAGHVDATLTPQRLLATLISGFGVIALLLAGAGLYGLLSFSVAQRTPEIGVRMALGARAADVVTLILREGMSLAMLGGLLGLVLAFALTRWVASWLYGVSAVDPLSFAAALLMLLTIALAACWFPARRATRVDPIRALRSE